MQSFSHTEKRFLHIAFDLQGLEDCVQALGIGNIFLPTPTAHQNSVYILESVVAHERVWTL